jgi:hypothetical protein
MLEASPGMNVRRPQERPAEPRRLEDVRSFAPLDPNESLNHEPLPDEGRGGIQLYRVNVDHRRLSNRELAAMVALPALFLLLAILGHAQVGAPVAAGVVFLFVLGLGVFAFSGRR